MAWYPSNRPICAESRLQSRPFSPHIQIILMRLSVALYGDGSHGIVRRLLRQAGEAHAEIVLVKLNFLAGRGQLGRLDFIPQSAQGYSRPRPEMDVHVERVALARETGECRAAGLALLALIDRLAVGRHPFANLSQNSYRFFRDRSIRLW